jgi:hypothetical protein
MNLLITILNAAYKWAGPTMWIHEDHKTLYRMTPPNLTMIQMLDDVMFLDTAKDLCLATSRRNDKVTLFNNKGEILYQSDVIGQHRLMEDGTIARKIQDGPCSLIRDYADPVGEILPGIDKRLHLSYAFEDTLVFYNNKWRSRSFEKSGRMYVGDDVDDEFIYYDLHKRKFVHTQPNWPDRYPDRSGDYMVIQKRNHIGSSILELWYDENKDEDKDEDAEAFTRFMQERDVLLRQRREDKHAALIANFASFALEKKVVLEAELVRFLGLPKKYSPEIEARMPLMHEYETVCQLAGGNQAESDAEYVRGIIARRAEIAEEGSVLADQEDQQ